MAIIFCLFFSFFLGLHLCLKNYKFSIYDYLAYFSIFFIFVIFNAKKETIKVERKVKDLYNSIAIGDFKRFKEIIETEFNSIKEVQECYYHVKSYLILYYRME